MDHHAERENKSQGIPNSRERPKDRHEDGEGEGAAGGLEEPSVAVNPGWGQDKSTNESGKGEKKAQSL